MRQTTGKFRRHPGTAGRSAWTARDDFVPLPQAETKGLLAWEGVRPTKRCRLRGRKSSGYVATLYSRQHVVINAGKTAERDW